MLRFRLLVEPSMRDGIEVIDALQRRDRSLTRFSPYSYPRSGAPKSVKKGKK